MDGLAWEMKSPIAGNRRAVERAFYHAGQQSQNVIMDLRRIRGNDSQVVKILEKCFKRTRHVRKMYVVTKNARLKTYEK